MSNTNTAPTQPTRRVRAGHAPLASLHRVNADQMHEDQTHIICGHIEQRSNTVPPQWHSQASSPPHQDTHPLEAWAEAHLFAAALGLVAGAAGLVALIVWAVRSA